MYAERDSTEKYSLYDMTRDEIELIQSATAGAAAIIDEPHANTSKKELARTYRRIAIAIDRALPNPEPTNKV